MKLGELLKKVNIVRAEADMDIEIHGVSYDSRTIRAGEIFVAVKGYVDDGNDFAEEAVARGAVCVLSERAPDSNISYVLVEDARKCLAAVSANWFSNPAEKLTIIGVTGTNGKTTVTNLIKEVLEKCTGKKVGLIGTIRNMIGSKEVAAERTTPESLEIHGLFAQMVAAGCKYAVMEVSSHSLVLDRVYGMEFEVGVFLNLTPDHMDFHDSMEEYAKAKTKLFTMCKKGAVNLDDAYAKNIIGQAMCPVTTFAVHDDGADLVGKSVKLHPDRVEFCALTIGTLDRVELKIPGMFSVYNALSAISAVMLLGFGVENISAVLQTCGGVKGRAEAVYSNDGYTVIIDYAHTPDALKNIIETMRPCSQGRIITLFGCGGDRDRTKRSVMGEIAAGLSDFVIVTSDNPRTEEPRAIIEDILSGIKNTDTPVEVIESRKEAIVYALTQLKSGDTLILAGKGHEDYQIIGKEKTHFDEREVVREFFS